MGFIPVIFFIGIIASPEWKIMSSVRLVINNHVISVWPLIISVPWLKSIAGISWIDKSGSMNHLLIRIVKYSHVPDTRDLSEMIIGDRYSSCPDHSSVIIVEDRDIFDLYHRSVIIKLYKRIVIVSGVIGPVGMSADCTGIKSMTNIISKVELPVGIDGEFHSFFHKDKGIAVPQVLRISVTCNGVPGKENCN